MKLMEKRWAALALAVIMVLSLGACGSKKNDESTESPFTAMETEDMDGNAVDGSVFAENKLTVLNVWNLGCSACIDEVPTLDALNKEYAEKDVEIMGLYHTFGKELSEQDRKDIGEILSGTEYNHVLTSKDMAESALLKDMVTFPATYFVNSEGNIVDTVYGSHDHDDWAEIIDSVLEKMSTNA